MNVACRLLVLKDVRHKFTSIPCETIAIATLWDFFKCIFMREPHTHETKSMGINFIQSCTMTTKIWSVRRKREDEVYKRKNKKKKKIINNSVHPSKFNIYLQAFRRLTKIKAARFSITSFHHFVSKYLRLCRTHSAFS